jgi:hypothetical protein
MEWDVFCDGKWIGTVSAANDEEEARAAALSKYSDKFKNNEILEVGRRA